MRQVEGRARLLKGWICIVEVRFEPRLRLAIGIAEVLGPGVTALYSQPANRPATRLQLQCIVGRVADVGHQVGAETIGVPEENDVVVKTANVVIVRQLPDFAALKQPDHSCVRQRAGTRQGHEREYGELLAAGDCRIVVGIEDSRRRLCQEAIAASPVEIVEKTVFSNDDLVEVVSSKQLGTMV